MTHGQERYVSRTHTLGSRPFSRGGLLDPTTSPLSNQCGSVRPKTGVINGFPIASVNAQLIWRSRNAPNRLKDCDSPGQFGR